MEENERNDPRIGTVVSGRYRILKTLGAGGMGTVYLAEHEAIEKKIALKVLHFEYSRKREIVTRFQQEAISASRIKHPNVLDVFDFGQTEDGCFYLAMEFLEGHDLADELVQARVIAPARGLRIALQICRALAAAHARGVVHRDLKPENVFLQRTPDGEEIVKIVDFGIAQLRSNEEAAAAEPARRRLTKTGMIFGTPEYMAPEQASGKHADARSDVYAVGIMLYELFTGAVPFTGDSFLGVLNKHLSEVAPPMNQVFPEITVSPELQATIMAALAKRPDERYASMGDFANALLATPEGQGIAAPLTATPALIAPAPPSGRYTSAPGTPTAAQFDGTPILGPRAAEPRGKSSAITAIHGSLRAEALTMAAETQLSAETERRTTLASGRGLRVAVFGAALVVALASAAAFLLYRHSRASAMVANSEAKASSALPANEADAKAAKAAEPAASASSLKEAESAPPKDPRVRLTVVTTPEGATIFKNGFQVCDSTPCEVFAARDETFELHAKKASLKGSAKVLAQSDQQVSIKLEAPHRSPRPKAKPPTKPVATSKPTLCEVEVDGIKILRPCP